jgi:cytochrome c5
MKHALLPLLVALALVGCKPQDPPPLPPQVGTTAPAPAAPAPAPAATEQAATPTDGADGADGEGIADGAVTADTAPVVAAAIDGAAIYAKACATCHATGLAGAPKLGDAADWGPRIAQGEALLHEHAIKGFTGKKGMMPPKGGFVNLSDDEIKAAVAHMTASVQ